MKSIFPSATAFILCITFHFVLLHPSACAAEDRDQELFVAFWNVENLFDTVDDPATEGDEEFTPSADKKWTQTRLGIKLSNLSRVICDMNEQRGPDILGLCEVENRHVVELLVKQLSRLKRDYGIVHQDSPSYRGIDCAVIYDRSKFELTRARFHRVPGMTTRDIVEAELSVDGHNLSVFVNHWPSRYNPSDARIKVAGVLRGRIDQILAANASADFVVLGDLNDTPADPSVAKTLRARSQANPKPGDLVNTMSKLHADANAGTYVYKNEWFVLDHVVVSPGLLDDRGLSWVRGSTATARHGYQMYVPRNPDSPARPSRSYSGPIFHQSGYSDHLPVTCRIRVGK
jgi:endonuclease/exonuclease/phosphatase family metal-dependent hydrolase